VGGKDDGGQVMEQEYFDIHMPSLKSVCDFYS
jgi:hypothetical protein